MDRVTREFVVRRAGSRCEYCGMHQSQVSIARFHVEHIRARQHQGTDSPDNLCLACRTCNSLKGTNQSAYDPLTGNLVRLFNPRSDDWDEHFRSERGWIFGLTESGRATIALLQMNRDDVLQLRQSSSDADR
jgi:hypothetical protein